MRAFSPEFRDELANLMRWRRDVRRFRTDPVPPEALARCLEAVRLAPSVGLSEPWRVVRVTSAAARAAALQNFEAANARALSGYQGDKAKVYAGLKLSGMRDAPEQLAFFCDDGTNKGAGLGAASMPEMRSYSVVSAITLMWLAARAEGLGLGWVSILDPHALTQALDVPESWHLVGYLCLGWPQLDSETPELETAGWDTRSTTLAVEER
ncbi:5,6-dimethylbenzimidazole synthase [Tropicimonas sp. S265A]|uniref:5,6-dimethylbenzimidazole synthase n=1 Tax=Tropicimonas sp. S265A TaxID=3415134 RepID=UPI003C7ED59C